MLDKYISIEEKDVVVGQDGKTGLWYCKELKTKTIDESGKKMLEMNKKLNMANIGKDTNNSKEEKKMKTVE